jgi:hypothetical protein
LHQILGNRHGMNSHAQNGKQLHDCQSSVLHFSNENKMQNIHVKKERLRSQWVLDMFYGYYAPRPQP